MSVKRFLARFIGDIRVVHELGQAATVRQLLPQNTRYVTAGAVAYLPDVKDFNKGAPGEGALGRDLGWIPNQDQTAALLVATDTHLMALVETGLFRQWELAQIAALDGHRRGGFLIFTHHGDGLAVSTQTPVQLPDDTNARTIKGVSNLFGGWENVLNVPHYF